MSDVPFMVVVSGYECPDGCIEVSQISKQPIIGTKNLYGSGVERLFVQKRFAEQYENSFNMRGGGGECEAADRQAEKEDHC